LKKRPKSRRLPLPRLLTLAYTLRNEGMLKLSSFAFALAECFKYRKFYGRMGNGHLVCRCNNAVVFVEFLRANGFNIGPENLDGNQWELFQESQREKGALKSKTHDAYVQTLRLFYGYWEGEGKEVPRWRAFLKYLDINDVEKLKTSQLEIQTLLGQLANHPSYLAAELGLYVVCSAVTGLRMFEILGLSPAQRTKIGKWPAFLIKGKGEKERYVPITPELDALLLAYGPKKPNVRYFQKIARYCWRLKYQVLNTQSRYLLIGLPGQTFGALAGRRFFATHCVRSGMEVNQVQLVLGHADIDSTMDYVDTEDRELLQACRDLNVRESLNR